MRIILAKDYEEMSQKAAHIIAGQIIMKPDSVLGLATGSTPLGTYDSLVTMHREGLLSFREATSFNLDEYVGLDGTSEQSYSYFMRKNFFEKVDISMDNVFIPSGIARDVAEECDSYEEKIRRRGGIDLQLLGIGRNGHIGFNEPDVKFEALTHLVQLDQETIHDNARFFQDIRQVPREAISMGIRTILHSRRILLLASGKEKADTVRNMIHGEIKPSLPASILQLHPDCVVILDQGAASKIV